MNRQIWPDALPREGNAKLNKRTSVSDWFEIYELDHATFALLEPYHWEEVFSYLIIGRQKAVLFDSGMGIADIKAEVEQLTSLPIVVVNSHAHFDHIGGNHAFEETWIFNHDHEIGAVQNGLSHEACMTYMKPDHYVRLPDGFNLETFRIPPKKITRRLRHLELIDLGDRRLTVHHTPGESPGQICLLDHRNKILFTADTFVPGSIPLYYPDSNLADYIKSIDYLAGLPEPVSWLCSSHNETYTDINSLLQLQQGLKQIKAGSCPFESKDNIRIYHLNGFQVSVQKKEIP